MNKKKRIKLCGGYDHYENWLGHLSKWIKLKRRGFIKWKKFF